MNKFVQITPLEGSGGWIVNTTQIIAVERSNINLAVFYLVGDIKIELSFKFETALGLLEVPSIF